MAGMDISASSTICRRCGTAYSRLKGYFPVSYAALYKGTGHLAYCRDCVDEMFNEYYKECGDTKTACKAMCRKLDLYWSDGAFNTADSQGTAKTVMSNYLAKIAAVRYAGKCYDDYLRDNGCLFVSPLEYEQVKNDPVQEEDAPREDIPEEYIEFWGDNFSLDFYNTLQRKYEQWTDGKDDLERSEVSLYKQICMLEATIERDSAAGKPIDKNVGMLNTLLGSLSLKPVQKKDAADGYGANTPFGVLIYKLETQRPVQDPDPAWKDVDGIVRYISIWFLGHLCKMLGIKNTYCKLYEEEIERLRVDHPEYDDEDDETMFNDIFSYGDTEE